MQANKYIYVAAMTAENDPITQDGIGGNTEY